ncbi:MAG: response regulator [Defluviitaleaceae bacterium]|nr:response regulator [Defluviitaleaceae bacterium]
MLLPCVLIIDDTPMVISALSRILLPFYKVKVARGGEEGMKVAERHHIDLVLLDINMPGLTGFDVFGKLRGSKKTRETPIIFITGSDDTTDRDLAFSLGAVDYIKKPFAKDDVLHSVWLHIKSENKVSTNIREESIT